LKKCYVVLKITATANPEPGVALSLIDKSKLTPDSRDTGHMGNLERMLSQYRWQGRTTEYSGQVEVNLNEYLESGIRVGDTVEIDLRKKIDECPKETN
jgi:hypothetical protein